MTKLKIEIKHLRKNIRKTQSNLSANALRLIADESMSILENEATLSKLEKDNLKKEIKVIRWL